MKFPEDLSSFKKLSDVELEYRSPQFTKKWARGNFIYKYVENGEIIYIGKSDATVESRILAHACEEKFANHKDAEIYIAELANKAETYAMELLLINKYRPKLNSAMVYENISNIKFEEPEWKLLSMENTEWKQRYEEGSYAPCYVGHWTRIPNKKGVYRTYSPCDLCGKYVKINSIARRHGIEYECETGSIWEMGRIFLCERCFNSVLKEPLECLLEIEKWIHQNRPDRELDEKHYKQLLKDIEREDEEDAEET